MFFLFLSDSLPQSISIKNASGSFKKSELRQDVLFSKDTIKTVKKFVMHKSPLRAVLYSAVLPGLGQFYNESYWKIPIIAAFGGYFGYEYIHYNNIAKDYEAQYVATQTPEFPQGDLRFKQLRDQSKDNRDQFIFYFGILYLANLVDAYVDAHIYDFDVSEKSRLSLTKHPGSLTFSVNF